MIGVFDSGYGGLTILRALIDGLPQYSYVYFGDNAHTPYGEKSADEIIELTKVGADFLFSHRAQVVILGCNTASAAALRHLQQQWLPKHYPDRRLLGILVPTIEQMTGAGWHHTTPITTPISSEMFTVGILATQATVESHAYPREIHKRNASLRVVQQACSGLVEAIEAGDDSKTKTLTERYVHALQAAAPDLRAVLLACTHYELIAPIIASLLPESVRLYHQPTIVAKSLDAYLKRHADLADTLERAGGRAFFTTGDPVAVSKAAARYFGKPASFEPAS